MSVWGKVIGGVAGFAVGGPIGAVIGAVAGHHVVDKKKQSGSLNQDDKQVAFTTAVIVLSAKMAKADGHVTRDEVNAFKQLFHIEPEDMPTVASIFDEAKGTSEGFEPFAEQIGEMFRGDWRVLEEIIGALFHIAKADGKIHPGEVQYLRQVALLFGFSDRDFDRLQTIYLGGWKGEGGRSVRADDAFEILNVSKDASDADIKKAYRNLVRENHPDTLMAKGMPEEFIELANEKLAKINDAYDRIKKARGFN
ncbi:TerB family tellurite resistance protein [Thalassospiraceae bacterium LMO-JJ14]|nr:TerB family tellurite resistance protein [Thalassospiraceae bacterium LMO-JJ14]